jgi:hypothetical protein
MKRLYWVWAAMIQRCENPKNKGYCNYGARGITVCPTWRNSFAQFVQDVGMPPKGMSIERIDNDKGYFKENCHWATRHQQSMNRRVFKNSHLGIKGIELRDYGSYRVRARRFTKIVLNVTVSDFFEACCIKKSFESKFN